MRQHAPFDDFTHTPRSAKSGQDPCRIIREAHGLGFVGEGMDGPEWNKPTTGRGFRTCQAPLPASNREGHWLARDVCAIPGTCQSRPFLGDRILTTCCFHNVKRRCHRGADRELAAPGCFRLGSEGRNGRGDAWLDSADRVPLVESHWRTMEPPGGAFFAPLRGAEQGRIRKPHIHAPAQTKY